MAGLLDKRLVFVTGKGGVGRTTVAVALGMAAARAGKRTIVCEVAGQERVARVLDRAAVGFAEEEIAPGLWGISIDPQRSIEEYLEVQLGSPTLSRMLFGNPLFGYFTAATPGLRELVTVGKAWDLAQPERHTEGGAYDLAVVDAPASGHGLALLRAPRTFRDVAAVGPIRRQADRIDSFLGDSAVTGVVAVALPEEMPVTETLEFAARLQAEAGMEVDRVVVNGLLPERFSQSEAARLEESRDADPAVALALGERARASAQREQLQRLCEGVRAEVSSLPFLFASEMGPAELELISGVLEAVL
jgi:anion-transporting  ArsA/GET3 family ATPase